VSGEPLGVSGGLDVSLDDGDAVAALEPAYYGVRARVVFPEPGELMKSTMYTFFSLRSERISSALLSFDASMS
jgi:hypothetical protein